MDGSKMDLYSASHHSVVNHASANGEGSNSAAQFYTSKYIRNSRAVGVLWAAFTVCTAVLDVVAFSSANWAGDTADSKGPGHFGLWRFCTVLSGGGGAEDESATAAAAAGGDGGENVVCIGDLNNFASILSPAFRASTIFVGLSVIVIVLCVVAFVLFCFMKANSVFELCGTMQFLSGICLAIGIISFPAGWDNDHVRSICGPEADDFELGTCGVRWAFVLAIIALLDCWILGCLAFTLAHRVVTPAPAQQQENPYMNSQSIYKGEVNSGFIGDSQSLSGSRKSLSGGLQPVMMVPAPPPPGGGPPPPHHHHQPPPPFGPPPPLGPPPPMHPDDGPPPGFVPAEHPGYDGRIQNFQL